MATLKQAEAARRKHADSLAEAGAHAVGVESGERFAHKGFVVVAYAEQGAKVDLPTMLAIPASKTVVPVVIERAKRFKPESL